MSGTDTQTAGRSRLEIAGLSSGYGAATVIRDVSFSLTEFNRDVDAYNAKLDGVLHGR